MIIRRKKVQTQQPETKQEPQNQKEEAPKTAALPSYDILNDIDIDTIAQERFERRRGDRRRGYRRVDDRNLISRAEEEAKLIKENAMRDGFNQGMMIGKQQLESLSSIIEDYMHAKEESIDLIQSDLAELSLKIAAKIIKKEVQTDSTVVLSIISDVIKDIGRDEKHIIIKVHPDDTDNIRENLPNLFPTLQTEAKIIIEADDDIETGSCIVETKNGLIDARFTTQLEILENAFKEKL
ncbi:MAG: FliH/SctL family protein [Candidatus Gastranaerophilales bacterium]|nr:FliH/SctL family protein [Candidatus Gastranaerophilales bacterium]